MEISHHISTEFRNTSFRTKAASNNKDADADDNSNNPTTTIKEKTNSSINTSMSTTPSSSDEFWTQASSISSSSSIRNSRLHSNYHHHHHHKGGAFDTIANDGSEEGWTINKLRFDNLNIHGRTKEIQQLKDCFQRMYDNYNDTNNNIKKVKTTKTTTTTTTANKTTSSTRSLSFCRHNNGMLSELVLIGGYSGTGKTTLVDTALTKSIQQLQFKQQQKQKQKQQGQDQGECGGLLVRGKFDFELKNSQPHAGIIQICHTLSFHISSLKMLNEKLYYDICESIWGSLKDTGKRFRYKVLSEFIPDIQTFLETYETKKKNDSDNDSDKSSNNNNNDDSVEDMEQSNEFNKDDKNRLYYAIQNFFGIVACFCFPLVIVLDDLQWSDASSLELLELLLTNTQEQPSPMMIVGCYRSNEVENDGNHILKRFIRSIKDELKHHYNQYRHHHTTTTSITTTTTFHLTELLLGNLSEDDTNHILMDLLNVDDEKITFRLAKLCHRRTDGNPFFFISFVSMLREEGFLEYNFGLMKWIWEDDAVIEKATMVTSNVVDIIRKKMSTKIQQDVKEILKLGALLGANFNERLIHLLWEEDQLAYQEDVEEDNEEEKSTNSSQKSSTATEQQQQQPRRSPKELLDDAISQAFLERMRHKHHQPGAVSGNGGNLSYGYRWVHDKIQEAAISLIPSKDLCKIKLHSGKILMEKLKGNELEQSIFIICNLLNAGIVAIQQQQDEEEEVEQQSRSLQIRIAQLNLQAARKAVRSSSFEIAAVYVEKGIEMLPSKGKHKKEDRWSPENKELSLQLYSIAVVVQNIIGNPEKVKQHCNVLLEEPNCCSPVDKIPAYYALVDCTSNTDSTSTALNLCLDVLGQHLDCRFPKNQVLRIFAIISGLRRAQKASKDLDAESILKKKFSSTDYEDMLRLRLLDKASTLCYFEDPTLMVLIMLRMLKLTTKNGFSTYSPIAYAMTAILMVAGLSDFEAGTKYADIAVELVHTMKLHRFESRCISLTHFVVYHWKRPIASSLKPLMRCYEVGLQVGDTESALSSLISCHIFGFFIGRPLRRIADDFDALVIQCRRLKKDLFLKESGPYRQAISNLLGRSDDTVILTGEHMDEKEFLKEMDKAISPLGYEVFRLLKLFVHVYYDEHDTGAVLAMEKGDSMLKAGAGLVCASMDPFYRAFLLLAVVRRRSKKQKNNKYIINLSNKHRSYLREAKRILKILKNWIQKGNPNLIHQETILEAELAALAGKMDDANELFRKATLLSSRQGILHEAALANERYAYFLSNDMNDKESAKFRGEEAIRLYNEWGCLYKVDVVRKEYVMAVGT